MESPDVLLTGESRGRQEGQAGDLRRDRLRGLSLAALLSFAVVAWEYLLNAVLNPVDWNLAGAGAHMALDFALVLPIASLALLVGRRLGRRFHMEPTEWAGLLGITGLVALVFLAAMAPVAATRDLAHEWMGNTYGLSLAEIQVTEVRTGLSVNQAKQLCSFTSLRNPSLAGNLGEASLPVLFRVETTVNALLTQLAALLPLLLCGLFLRFRAGLPRASFEQPRIFLRWFARPLRLGTLALLGVLGFCFGGNTDEIHAQAVVATTAPVNACENGGPVKEYKVHAINVVHTVNRYFDFVPGFMYALEANIPAIRAFEQSLITSRQQLAAANNINADLPGITRVTPGLRKDPIQPLVIRANLGDCVRIHFTNDLVDGHPASLHILGLSHTVQNAGSAVGQNAPSYALQGQTVTYEIPIPTDPAAERAYHFHDHGAGTVAGMNPPAPGRFDWRLRQGLGLFGALVVEPQGSTYLDVETGEELDTETGSTWEAIIIDPNVNNRPDGKSFREFVILYHEFGAENYRGLFDFRGAILPHLDGNALSGAYKMVGRAINYRSEPFRRRIELNDLVNGNALGSIRHGKNLSYASYPFGDPPTPMPRSYLGEATKTRVLHAGTEIFHVHHLHGGGDRWRRNPDADSNSNFWKGLTKVPNQTLKSVHLDSQSIGPGSSYNLEHECGAGGCQQGEGEFLYHCHIGHHYVAGMWSFWRVYATEQTAENEIHGHALYVEPRLFQADNVFSNSQAPSNTPPAAAVSAGQLIGVKVDWNRTIVADANFNDPFTQVKLSHWIADQLPPQGVRIDANDATVWDWITTGAPDATYKVFGEPEETRAMANWKSPAPGVRPEVKFNPKNGRYAWPLFRPHAAQRPPFTARHSGSPWLGEQMIPGRMDGLCANNFVHSGVSVGPKAQRWYPVSAVTLPIQVTRATPPGRPSASDPNGMLFVLNEHKADLFAGLRPAEPLAIRSNVGDCVELVFTNEIPDGPLNNNWSKVNIHSHFVQFDTQASDGVISGFSYEQSVRPYATENRTLTQAAAQFTNTLKVTNVDRLRPGIWIGIGLGEATCGSILGQPFPCTEIRKITSITAPDTITLDLPLLLDHDIGEAVGVEFVRYNWYSDVDFGTVFFHTHVESKDWDHGLFGAHIVEPKGSTYHDPVTGNEIRAGTLADIRVNPSSGGKPVAAGVNGSFREFMTFVHNQNPVVGQFDLGGGTINLRAEPWSLRPGDAAYRFSSVTHGDPFTQEVRAYVGDPVVFRGMGLVEKLGGLRVTGHRFNIERYSGNSDLRDTTFIGISERYDFALEGGAGGPKGYPGDYMYYSTNAKDFESGAWGLLRVYDTAQGDLQPLPGFGTPSGGTGFPTLTQTGGAPPELNDGPGTACPAAAVRKAYNLSIADTTIIFNNALPGEPGVAYFLNGDPITDTRTPMVVRVNKGECLQINLTNQRATKRSGFSVGELLFDPQRSYGTAIGFNHDSTVAPGATRTYEYYADKELGLILALNLADSDSLARGAWGGVVVEPEGSTYRSPGTLNPLPGGGAGIQADIVKNGLATREFVALFMDAEDELNQDRMPYPPAPEFTNSVSYSNEPLSLRNFLLDPANVFRSALHGDPRHVVTVPKGASIIYRAGSPWAETAHLPTLEGHRYRQEPGMAGSEVLFNDVLAPGMTLNMEFLSGAGGDLQAPGDYLFLERAQNFLQTGLWNILRVTDPAAGGAIVATDTVTVTGVDRRGGKTTLRGFVSTKPAGDTVGRLALFEGVENKGRCAGKRIGTIRVNRGSGRWQHELGAQAPAHVCLQSPGGGVASGPTGNLVTDRTKRMTAAAEEMLSAQRLKAQLLQEFEGLEETEAEEQQQ
jgi:manganese oxidase